MDCPGLAIYQLATDAKKRLFISNAGTKMNSAHPTTSMPNGLGATSHVFVSGSQDAPIEIHDDYLPIKPKTIKESGLTVNDLIPLVLKFMFLHGCQSGRQIAEQVKLPFVVLEPVLASLKADLLVGHKGAGIGGDYQYELSPKGVEQAKLALERNTYCGSAPVCLAEYKKSIHIQSVKNLRPTFDDVRRAFEDLVISDLLIAQMGQAINSGRSLFLYGPPGNGKTSLSRRAIRAVNQFIWIPRCLTIGGEIIRLFDPNLHDAAPLPPNKGLTHELEIDERWIRLKRPTIAVGGELTLKHLEATLNPVTGIIEAPVHVKSNCGCLVVDDFGRQQISTTELLNRWIVPMECGHDYLNLPSGRQIELPFEQLLIFSTNLEPKHLCDEAFLRRIPYKIEVFDPTEEQFRKLFTSAANKHGIELQPGVLDYLIEYQYKRINRNFRFCHVEDLLMQARDFCEFHGKPWVFTKDIAELACLNYFSGMETMN
jgi:hypothetical protein